MKDSLDSLNTLLVTHLTPFIPRKIAGEQMTAELLHWRYIFPCLLGMMQDGQLSRERADDIFASLRQKPQPDRSFFEEYFPKPTNALHAFGYDTRGCRSDDGVWSLKVVHAFWIEHKGDPPDHDCFVRRVIIRECLGARRSPLTNTRVKTFRILDENACFTPIFDMYGFDLVVQSWVWIHRRVIVEF